MVAAAALPALPASPVGVAHALQDFQKLAEAMIAIQAAGSPAKAAGNVAILAGVTDATCLFKTCGLLCLLDMLERMLTICGLQQLGQEEDRLPEWITTLAMTNLVSKDGRRTVIKKVPLADPKYHDEQPIPITPQLIRMIMTITPL